LIERINPDPNDPINEKDLNIVKENYMIENLPNLDSTDNHTGN